MRDIMFHGTRIFTSRLELVPATGMILRADLDRNPDLGRLLDAHVPSTWPPAFLDDSALEEFIRQETERKDPNFCCWYWILTAGDPGTRTLIGSGGTLSMPGSPDTVMIGYSVLDAFRNRGYATEAIGQMIPVIFTYPDIRKIRATTYPHLQASIRVLEKCGFVPDSTDGSGHGFEEGTIAFERERPGS